MYHISVTNQDYVEAQQKGRHYDPKLCLIATAIKRLYPRLDVAVGIRWMTVFGANGRITEVSFEDEVMREVLKYTKSHNTAYDFVPFTFSFSLDEAKVEA
jgi:hypothetical protein